MDVATPTQELYDRIDRLGWTVKKVDLKNGTYVARGAGPAGEKVDRTGRTPEHALGALLQYAVRANEISKYAARRYAAWATNWLGQSDEIARAYSEMPVYDEKAVPAWRALAAESKIQADAIRKQIDVEVVDDPEPYDTAEEMCKDVHQNKHFLVSRANSQHPVWSEQQSIDFRIVHDVVGHCQSGGNFSWVGENLACGAHFPILSPLAREALFVECIAQTAYFKHYKGFGNQKVGLLSEFLDPAQEQEGEHPHVPHGGMPNIQSFPAAEATPPTAPGVQTEHWMAPHEFNPGIITQSSTERDPNAHLVSQGEAPDVLHDYINLPSALQHVNDLKSDWQDKAPHVQRQAVVNAFRAALLGDRKHPKWQAAHYQAVAKLPPEASAADLWDEIETAREQHVKSHGGDLQPHMRHGDIKRILAGKLKGSASERHRQAVEHMHDRVRDFEALLGPQDEDHGKGSEMQRYELARKMMLGALVGHIALHHAPTDHFNNDEWQHFEPEGSDYGASMAAPLDLAELVGQHANSLTAAAQTDLHHGGHGYMFRNAVKQEMPYLDPSTVSFAWRLLSPETSELAHDDPHTLRALQMPSPAPLSDFYRHERMLRAAKDATGYGHVPLATYQMGLDDLVRHPGKRRPHGVLHPLNPEPWMHAEHPTPDAADQPWQGPEPFELARHEMNKASRNYDLEPHTSRTARIEPVRTKTEAGWTVSGKRDPDYIFIWYMDHLRIEPWHHNRSQSDMIQELLKEFDTNVQGIANDFDPHEVAAGTVYVIEDDGYYIDIQSLSRPEVNEYASLAVHEWLQNETGTSEADDQGQGEPQGQEAWQEASGEASTSRDGDGRFTSAAV